MPRYKEPFTVYTRTNAAGKEVFYYRTYDENDNRTSGRSTGLTSKPAARRYCMKRDMDDGLSGNFPPEYLAIFTGIRSCQILSVRLSLKPFIILNNSA